MFISQALRRLEKVQTDVLGYKFQDPYLLLEALTHKSGQLFYNLPRNYEKLELLGDAILDYLVNSNLLRFTLFEKYMPNDTGVYRL
jgi:dsRNA-specific ribonuclease